MLIEEESLILIILFISLAIHSGISISSLDEKRGVLFSITLYIYNVIYYIILWFILNYLFPEINRTLYTMTILIFFVVSTVVLIFEVVKKYYYNRKMKVTGSIFFDESDNIKPKKKEFKKEYIHDVYQSDITKELFIDSFKKSILRQIYNMKYDIVTLNLYEIQAFAGTRKVAFNPKRTQSKDLTEINIKFNQEEYFKQEGYPYRSKKTFKKLEYLEHFPNNPIDTIRLKRNSEGIHGIEFNFLNFELNNHVRMRFMLTPVINRFGEIYRDKNNKYIFIENSSKSIFDRIFGLKNLLKIDNKFVFVPIEEYEEMKIIKDIGDEDIESSIGFCFFQDCDIILDQIVKDCLRDESLNSILEDLYPILFP